jgi:hypothetical protein
MKGNLQLILPVDHEDREVDDNEDDKYIELFNRTLDMKKKSPVLLRGDEYLAGLTDEKLRSWTNEVTSLFDQLRKLNKTYQPSEQFSEAAKRLIINEVIISVCSFVGVHWTMEHSMNKKSRNIGWGQLDFYLNTQSSTAAIILGVTDEVVLFEEEETMELTIDPVEETLIEKEQEEMETAIIRKKRTRITEEVVKNNMREDTEAKDKFSDSHLVQLAAQMYDLYQERLVSLRKARVHTENIEIHGVLTTGRRWKFFNLHSSESRDRLPVLRYDGELRLHVLKTILTKQAISKSKRAKRISGLYVNEDVNINEVRDLFKALIAACSA